MTNHGFFLRQKRRIVDRIAYTEAVIRAGGPRAALKVRVLPNLKRALAKIQLAHYLRCDDCGDSIDKKRLEKIPGAIRCAECQKRHEAEL